MLRFIPDSFTDGLLRPLLLGDPVVGLYLEMPAPDWRFALMLAFLAIGGIGWALRRRGSAHPAPEMASFLTTAQVRLLIGLALSFYLWTFLSGNGRYFVWALLLIGPLVVVAARRLPSTRAMRNAAIVGALVVQSCAVWMTYEPNLWGLRAWREGPGLALARTPLRDKPAVFLTIGFISHSILVPQLHPQSRWANITGQREIVPGMPEYTKLEPLLNSTLPKYVLFNAPAMARAEDYEPLPEAREAMHRILRQQNLRLLAPRCEFVAAAAGDITPWPRPRLRARQPIEDGFWFCPIEPVLSVAPGVAAPRPPVAPEFDDVFDRVEQHCPRWFPRGSATTRLGADGVLTRLYAHSDTTVHINEAGGVYFKYFRALNPTVLGDVESVRQGRIDFDCRRLPGRYVPPWSND